MIYLFIEDKTIKILNLKKTLLGQEETSYFKKNYETQLLNKGKPVNIDLLASAIKEVITTTVKNDNQITLILPQEAFFYFRTEVPSDIAPTALNSFITDKARSILPLLLEEIIGESFIKESNGQKVVTFFGLSKELLEDYQQALTLIDLKISSILPDTLTYFKLFEKTLRNEKKENILYVRLQEKSITGYLFDNFGLVDDKKFFLEIDEKNNTEKILKEKNEQLIQEKKKLNRIIISGSESDKIRQDTFTKAVGVWTNPLKKIVPTFYESYLKSIVVETNKPFPILTFDTCFGAFIFSQEEKFSLVKNSFKSKNNKSFIKMPRLSLLRKEILLFFSSFILSFITFLVISNIKSIKLPIFRKKTPSIITPTITPTLKPTPSFRKEELKIQILNGSGVAGKASELKEILIKKGYREIITGNADNYEYKITQFQVKKSKSQAMSMIKEDLKDYLITFKETELGEKEIPDVIITFGSDFK